MSVTTSYSVSNLAALNAAIAAIDVGGASSATSTSYTIKITADLTLGADIAAINLAAGDTLLITGAKAGGNPRAVVSGNGVHRGFSVLAGSVTLASMSLQGLRAHGGNGGAGAPAGGGGAGLGGAVFVGTAGSVTLTDVRFSTNGAIGGNGGAKGTGVAAGGSGAPGGLGAGAAGGASAGFGGGGGGGGTGGFGGGNNAGGGLAAGGNVFVQQGGQLIFSSGTITGGTATGGKGGSGGTSGQSLGGGMFIQGNGSITLGNALVTGVISDQGGAGGAGTVAIAGAATLSAANTFTGGVQILVGSLTLLNSGAAGSGAISFTAAGEVLRIGSGAVPANAIAGFGFGETIDLLGIGTATSAVLDGANHLALSGGAVPASLTFDPGLNLSDDSFVPVSDGTGGTSLTLVQSHFHVATAADLNAAIAAIDVGGTYARPGLAYTITLDAGVTLGADPYAVNLPAGGSLTLDGGGNTLDGGGLHRGLFVYAGQVTIENLTIADTSAIGGAGGAGALPGGGGAGLGGGVFVGAAGTVTLADVQFAGDSAIGGNAGAAGGIGLGGGGGLGGAGGAGNTRAGGGGGVGSTATGGTADGAGGAGIVLGAAGGNAGTGNRPTGGPGGANGGGGGAAGTTVTTGSGRGGGGSHTYPGIAGSGGVGGSFGGGGSAGGTTGIGEAAGFGGGGANGAGGWGGGGGGGGAGGFGGGAGNGLAGGGLGAGGDVFVQQGGSLLITAGTLGAGSVAGGSGTGAGAAGSAWGSAIFLQGGSPLTLAPLAGQTIDIAGTIADAAGVGGSGAAGLILSGACTVALDAANSFTGGILISAGTLDLTTAGAGGIGEITFAYGATAELIASTPPLETLRGVLPGITIDLQGIGSATAANLGTDDVLLITGGTVPVSLTLDPVQIFTNETFATVPDGSGGTLITALTTGNDHPPHIAGTGTVIGDDHTPLNPLAAVTVSDLDPGADETATITLSSTANGTLSTLGGGSYDPASGIYTVTGTAASVTAALQGLVFTPTEYQVQPGQVEATSFALSVTDGTMADAGTTTLDITALNDAPVVNTGNTGIVDSYWNVPFTPIPHASVTDPDAGAMETVTITLADSAYPSSPTDGNGTLALAMPGFTLSQTAPGTYQLSAGSPADVTAALDAITFTAIPHPAQPGFTLTYISLSASDGIAPAATTNWTEIATGLPVFTGMTPGQTVAANATLTPFSLANITDSAGLTIQGLTVSIDDPATNTPTDAVGKLTGAGLTKASVGTYTLAINPGDTFATVSAELDTLVFTPKATAIGKTVELAVSAFDGATTASNWDTTITVTPAIAASTMSFLPPAPLAFPATTTTAAMADIAQTDLIPTPPSPAAAVHTDPTTGGLAGDILAVPTMLADILHPGSP